VCLACCNEEDREKQIDRAKKRNGLRGTAAKLKSLPQNKKLVSEFESKSKMLILADSLFSKYIINRDSDNNGNVYCPGCNKVYNIEQTDNLFYQEDGVKDRINNDRGNKIIQTLHFVERSVYSIRHDEDNGHAGCCYCNLDMHLHPKGTAAQNYRSFMVKKYGEAAVIELEQQKRKINKLELTQLKNIIEHYESNG
jgi:uncharacterized Zn-finger protein